MSTAGYSGTSLKRKPDEELRAAPKKLQKTSTPTANSSKPISQLDGYSGAKLSLEHLDTTTTTTKGATKPTLQNSQQPRPLTSTLAKTPKKGSFAEIMARAATLQDTYEGKIGKIQHKPVEAVGKMRQRLQHKKFKTFTHVSAEVSKQRAEEATRPVRRPGQSYHEVLENREKKLKKDVPATTGYQGTARPIKKASTTKSVKKSSVSPPRTSINGCDGKSSARYSRASPVEQDDDEDGRDYDSDASSDMEAAAYEVDEEEDKASRIARREDAAALAEENRLKREKEDRKKKLAAMAKAR